VLVLLKQLMPVASQHIECWTNLGIKGWIEAAIAAVAEGEYQSACGFLCLCSREASLSLSGTNVRPWLAVDRALFDRYA
jgi:hypothetical protein